MLKIYCRNSILVGLIVLATYKVAQEQSKISLLDTDEEFQQAMFMGQIRGPLQSDEPQLLSYLIEKILIQPSAMPYNLTPDTKDFKEYQFESHEFGWKFLDYYIKLLFSDQRDGFFFEAGALNGEFNSNTLWLEKTNNWTGILVEPDQTNFKHLEFKRRKSWISNSCISGYTYPREILLQTLVKSAVTRFTKLRGIWLYRSNAREVGNLISKNPGPMEHIATPSYSRVQCFPLYSYLKVLNISTLDLLSLDMQGNEWNALKSLPWESLKIRALFIEHIKNDIHEDEIDQDFVKYITGRGYRLVDFDDKHNYIFILKDDSVLEPRTDPHIMKKYNPDVRIKWV